MTTLQRHQLWSLGWWLEMAIRTVILLPFALAAHHADWQWWGFWIGCIWIGVGLDVYVGWRRRA